MPWAMAVTDIHRLSQGRWTIENFRQCKSNLLLLVASINWETELACLLYRRRKTRASSRGFVHSGVPIVWGRSDRSRDVPGSLDHSEHLRVCRWAKTNKLLVFSPLKTINRIQVRVADSIPVVVGLHNSAQDSVEEWCWPRVVAVVVLTSLTQSQCTTLRLWWNLSSIRSYFSDSAIPALAVLKLIALGQRIKFVHSRSNLESNAYITIPTKLHTYAKTLWK